MLIGKNHLMGSVIIGLFKLTMYNCKKKVA